MISVKKHTSFIFGSLLLLSCGQMATPDSKTKGHFDAGDEVLQAQFKGTQIMIPELIGVRTKAVIIGLPLIAKYGRIALVDKILESEIEELIIVAPLNSPVRIDRVSEKKYALTHENGIVDEFTVSAQQKIRIIKALKTNGSSIQDKKNATVWARDWAPLSAFGSDAKLRLIDFNYYPDRKVDDTVSRALAATLDLNQPIPRVPIPLYFEGGNFTMDGLGNCFISSSVVQHNATNTEGFNDRIYTPAEIVEQFKQFVGCSNVEIINRMPYEGTGHLDMWLKFVDKKKVIVAEIPEDFRQLPIYDKVVYQTAFSLTKNFLDQWAQTFQSRGYQVYRIPMPAPMFYDVGKDEITGAFRSYTNSLLLNDTIIVPYYSAPLKETEKFKHPKLAPGHYPDESSLRQMETIVERVYKEAGLTLVRWANSDNLIEKGGAVHCVTMQIPYL